MAILGEDSSWLASNASMAQRKVSGLARSCSNLSISSSLGRWVHPDPDGFVAGSKVGDVPDEPRQWCAFEHADAMEQGLAAGVASSFLEIPEEEMRLCVERSPDRKQFCLTTKEGNRLLLARLNDNGDDFSIYVTRDGEPPSALGPAWTLSPNSTKDRWTLSAKTCDHCESRGKRLCGRRELAFISHSHEEVGQGQVCCMDVEIPEVSQKGIADVWCPMCSGQDSPQRYMALTTKRPKWNTRRKTLSLDFYGRCNLASAKNFQLEVTGKPEKVRLLFGKVGTNQFVLDFQRPLAMVQAFAAAVSTTVWK